MPTNNRIKWWASPRWTWLVVSLLLGGIAANANSQNTQQATGETALTAPSTTGKSGPEARPPRRKKPIEKIRKTDRQWRAQLTRKQYQVTRRGETESARTGRYWRHREKGTYLCVCCDLPLFPSTTKYKSGTGWPSFFAPLDEAHIETRVDRKLFYSRTEVLCKRCDAHLGHVFSDGPRPTGLRFCLNSAALKFRKFQKPKAVEPSAAESDTAEPDAEDSPVQQPVADPEDAKPSVARGE